MSHLLISGNNAIANIDNICIESEDTHKNLGITTDSKLTFETHIKKLCKKGKPKTKRSCSNF